MAIVSDVEIRLRADIARLQQDLNGARRSVSGAVDDIKKTLAGMASGFSLAALAKQVIDAQRQFDKLNSSLVTVTGSQKAANEAMKALQDFAASTPFSLQEVTTAFIKLRNLGLTPSERALTSYGNTASAMGKDLNQLIEAVADAATGEFERLKEFGITAKQQGDQVGFTFQGMTTMVGKNAKDIEAYLTKIGEVNFAGGMARQADTLDGALSNLGDAWSQALVAFSQTGFGDVVRGGVMALSAALGDLAAIFKAVSGAAGEEGKKVEEIGFLHKGLTTFFEAITVLGVNVSYVFKTIGKDLGAFAAQAAALFNGGIKGLTDGSTLKAVQDIGRARVEESKQERKEVDETSARVLGAAQAAQAVREKEAADRAKDTQDRLAGYKVELSAEEQRKKAKLEIVDIENRLNGVNKETAGELLKLKTAFDLGAISQAEYSRYLKLINKATIESSTGYKDQVKHIELTTEAIKRRAEAQQFDNKQSQAALEFLNRTGQLSDEDLITKTANLDVQGIREATSALQDQLTLAKKKLDNEKEQASLRAQIALADRDITARRTKEEQDLFELEVKRAKLAANNYADLVDAAQAETKAQKDQLRDQKDATAALGMTSKQITEVTVARLRDQAARLDEKADLAELIDLTGQLSEQYRAQADAIRARASDAVFAEELKRNKELWNGIEQVARDTFMSIGDGNKNMWQRMKETAKNLFFNWLYEMTVKKWIINVGANFSGAGAVADIASAQGSGGSGAGGNIASYASLMKSGFSSAGASGAGAGISSSTTVGSMGSVAGGAIAGNMAGRAISNGYSVTGGSGNSTVNLGTVIGTAIGYYFGGPVGGALIGGIVGGVVNRAFGYKAKEIRDAAIVGSLGPGGFSGDMKSDWVQKGGWFRSDKTGTDYSAVDPEVAASLGKAYSAIKTSSAEYAKALGINADSIATRTQELNIKLSKDQAESTKAINDFFAGVSDTIAGEIIPNIGKFSREGETASATLQRLAADFQTVEGVLATLGTTSERAFGAVGLASLDARERLVLLAGGIDALAQQTQFFADNFLTKAQQIAPAQRELADGLAALGYANLQTKDDYAKAVLGLVDSGALATEQGAKLYAELMKLGPAFKAVADYTEELQAAARDAGRTQADAALDELRRAVDSQKNVAMAAYDAVMGRLSAGIDTVNGTIERTGNLSRALKAALGTVDSPAQQVGMRAAAQAQITASLAIAKAGGALPTAEDLRDALAALGRDASSQFSTLADYQREVARTNNELVQMGGMADVQLSTAERQLLVLQEQAALTKAASDAQLARFDAMVSNAQDQVSALAATNNTLNDIYGVVSTLRLQAAQVNYGQYQQTLGAEMLRQLDAPVPNYTAPSATINSDAAILAALQSLESRMANVETNTQRAAAATVQFAQQFDQVSAGGNALATEAVG